MIACHCIVSVYLIPCCAKRPKDQVSTKGPWTRPQAQKVPAGSRPPFPSRLHHLQSIGAMLIAYWVDYT